MLNEKAVTRFEQAHGVKIEKMFWIAGSIENSSLNDLIADMDDKQFKNCFPEILNVKVYEKDFLQALIDYDKFGIVAEILIPIANSFKYSSDGTLLGWSSSGGYCRIDYVYAETLELLLNEIEKSADKHFEDFKKKDKINNKKKVSKLRVS